MQNLTVKADNDLCNISNFVGFGLKNSAVMVPKGLTYSQSPDLLQGFYVISDVIHQVLKPSPAPETTDSKWQTIVAAGLSAGVQESVLEKAVLQLKKARFTPEQARMILFPLFRDLALGRHARYVLDKLADAGRTEWHGHHQGVVDLTVLRSLFLSGLDPF